MSAHPTYRAGGAIEDHCRQCKTDRMHTVIVVDRDGRRSASPATTAAASTTIAAGPGSRRRARRRTSALRRARRAPSGAEPFPIVSDRERIAPAMTLRLPTISSCCCGASSARKPASRRPRPPPKWRGGTLVLRPGAGAAGEELADRDVLPQDRDAAQSPAHARAAGQRLGSCPTT